MPKTIIKRKPASTTRKRIGTRKNRKEQGRKRSARPAQKGPAVIANSIFALTLKPISGVKVECDKSVNAGVAKLVIDMRKCFDKLVPGNSLHIPEHLPDDNKLEILIREIKRNLTKDQCFNIDIKGDHHILTIYQECKYVNYMPSIQLGDALLKLKTDYPRLHDVFILFLQTLRYKLGLDGWWEDSFQHSFLSLEDEIYNAEEGYSMDADPEWIEEAKVELEEYKSGDPYKYQQLIIRSKVKSTELIRSQLNRLKRNHPFKKLILDGCMIIDAGLNMFSFNYQPDGEKDENDKYYNNDSLRFENQAMLYWKFNCASSDHYGEYIDFLANEGGVDVPVYHQSIIPGQKEDFDMEKFNAACKWPMQLADYFDNVCTEFNKYCKK